MIQFEAKGSDVYGPQQAHVYRLGESKGVMENPCTHYKIGHVKERISMNRLCLNE